MRNKCIKVAVDFPRSLYDEAQTEAAVLSLNRSGFIRQAVERYIEELREKRLEQQLIDGYIENASVAAQVAEEFSKVEV